MKRLLLRYASLLAFLMIAGCGDKPASPAAPAARVDDGAADVVKGLEALAQEDPMAASVAFATAAAKCETNFEARLAALKQGGAPRQIESTQLTTEG